MQKLTMNKLAKIGYIVITYLIYWSVVYSLFMEFDYRYYFEYLYLAWVGPGPIPAYIQIISVFLTVITLLISWYMKKKK